MDLHPAHLLAASAVASWTNAAFEAQVKQEWKGIARTAVALDDAHSCAVQLAWTAIERGVDCVLSGNHKPKDELPSVHVHYAQKAAVRLAQEAMEEAARQIVRLAEAMLEQRSSVVIDPATIELVANAKEGNYGPVASGVEVSAVDEPETMGGHSGHKSDAKAMKEATTEFSANLIGRLIDDAIKNVAIEPHAVDVVSIPVAAVAVSALEVDAVSGEGEGKREQKLQEEPTAQFSSNFISCLLHEAIRNVEVEASGLSTIPVASAAPEELEPKGEGPSKATTTVESSTPHASSEDNPLVLAVLRPPKGIGRSHMGKPHRISPRISPTDTSPRSVTIDTRQPPRLRKLEEYMAMHPVGRAKKVSRSPKQKPVPSHHDSPPSSGYHADGDNSDSDSPPTPTTRHAVLAPLVMPPLPSPLKVKPASTVIDRPDRLGLMNKPKMRSGYCQQCLHEGRSCKISDCLKHQLLR